MSGLLSLISYPDTFDFKPIPYAQVGSKIDKAASRAVQYEEGVELAERFGAMFVEVSSKTRENVRRPFVDVVDKIVETPELLNARKGLGDNTVQVGREAQDNNGCAC